MPSACYTPLSSLSQKEREVFKVAFIAVAVPAALLNAISASLLVKLKFWNTFTNALLASLVVGDILVALGLSPLTIAQLILPVDKQSCFVIKAASLLVSLLAITSLTVGAISYDRYQLIARGKSYHQYMTTKRKIFVIAFPWVAPLILILARLLDEKAFTWITLSLYVGCYSVLIVCYLRLVWFLDKCVAQLDHFKGDEAEKQVTLRRNQKATRLIFFIMVTIIGCTLGTCGYRILMSIHFYKQGGWEFFVINGPRSFAVGQVMFQFNSAANPVLYFFKHSEIRRAMAGIWRNIRSRRIAPEAVHRSRGNRNLAARSQRITSRQKLPMN